MGKRKRRAFTQEFKAGALRLVQESGKSVPTVARELDLTETALPAARNPPVVLPSEQCSPGWGDVATSFTPVWAASARTPYAC